MVVNLRFYIQVVSTIFIMIFVFMNFFRALDRRQIRSNYIFLWYGIRGFQCRYGNGEKAKK